MGAVGARKHQGEPVGAVLEVVQGLRIGERGIGVVDPLHDLPWRGGGPPRDRCGALGARIDRLDPEAIRGLADQSFERRALQHAVDQLAPVVVAGRREISRQPQVVRYRCHPACRSLEPFFVAGNCHGATAKPNGCFGVLSRGFRSGKVRQPLDSLR